MKFILTKRFMGLIAYSVLTFWMVFYGDMASKIIGVSAACALIIVMAYRIEDLLVYISKLEKNEQYGEFGDGNEVIISKGKPDTDGTSERLVVGQSPVSVETGTTLAPDICLDNDDEDNLFRRSNLKEKK